MLVEVMMSLHLSCQSFIKGYWSHLCYWLCRHGDSTVICSWSCSPVLSGGPWRHLQPVCHCLWPNVTCRHTQVCRCSFPVRKYIKGFFGLSLPIDLSTFNRCFMLEHLPLPVSKAVWCKAWLPYSISTEHIAYLICQGTDAETFWYCSETAESSVPGRSSH